MTNCLEGSVSMERIPCTQLLRAPRASCSTAARMAPRAQWCRVSGAAVLVPLSAGWAEPLWSFSSTNYSQRHKLFRAVPAKRVQPLIHSGAHSLLTTKINTAYTNMYPYSFTIHLLKSEHFLVTQLRCAVEHFILLAQRSALT